MNREQVCKMKDEKQIHRVALKVCKLSLQLRRRSSFVFRVQLGARVHETDFLIRVFLVLLILPLRILPVVLLAPVQGTFHLGPPEI